MTESGSYVSSNVRSEESFPALAYADSKRVDRRRLPPNKRKGFGDGLSEATIFGDRNR
jgi:hypothetical protein